jgi:hypothetical protein
MVSRAEWRKQESGLNRRAAKQIALANKSNRIAAAPKPLQSLHWVRFDPLTLLLIHLSSRLTLVLPTLSAHSSPLVYPAPTPHQRTSSLTIYLQGVAKPAKPAARPKRSTCSRPKAVIRKGIDEDILKSFELASEETGKRLLCFIVAFSFVSEL